MADANIKVDPKQLKNSPYNQVFISINSILFDTCH